MNKQHIPLIGKIIQHTTAVVIIISVFAATLFPQTTQAFSFANITKMFTQDDEISEKTAGVFPTTNDIEPRKTIWATMTAYSSDVAQTDSTPCIPADYTYDLCENYELHGAQDTIAANFLPMGTQVRFPDLYGDKIFTVRDRMNKRYGWARGDIWMPERTQAVAFGVKRIKMEIYYR